MIEPIEYIQTTPSTNTYLTNCAPTQSGGCGKAVATFEQTQGKGQRGNIWLSEPGKNIQYSLSYVPNNIPSHKQFLISQAVSLAVHSFLKELTTDLTVKWPNDIYRKEKKLGGILIEHRIKGSLVTHSIIGIGLNINQTSFPSHLPDAVSLNQVTGQTYNLTKLTEDLHQTLCTALEVLSLEQEDSIRRHYIDALYRKEGFHPYTDKNGSFMARICGIEAGGSLILEREDGSISAYAFKEVQYCRASTGTI